jgi:phosphoglycerol transferase MdoB-like AlkP superfamily enzyme
MSGFDNITTLDDFDQKLYTSKWGVHDHFMFEKSIQELDSATGKFFKVILTLSSHEPFDVPMDPFIKGSDPESLFVNSCHYTDKSVGSFIAYCKKQKWWDNTVVVITADHGHRHPGNKELYQKERFKIPLLLVGGAIKKDTVVSTIGSQTDIANTLLAQLDKPRKEFEFSKNLLSKNVEEFAAYFFNDGYGFISPGKYAVWDNAGKRFMVKEGTSEADLNITKAYQQVLYNRYNNIDKNLPNK